MKRKLLIFHLCQKRKRNQVKSYKQLNIEKKVIIFNTGNQNKFNEFSAIIKSSLPDVEVRQEQIEVPEVQGDPDEIIKQKALFALDKKKGPIILEDTSLCFNAFQGLPGPYIRSFLEKLKPEGLHNMIKGQEDKTAYAQCIFAIAKTKKNILLFHGKTDGEIVAPRGADNFGWDPIFQPKGFNQTYAEMRKDEKNKISHRSRAVEGLINYLKENPDFWN
jgi:inosine triphosphate pyrophosphatase